MTLNARFILKWATDGTLDVRTLWLSDSTIRTGIARGGGGEWAGGLAPLHPCGQLTSCFSAVAELLVGRGCRRVTLIVIPFGLNFCEHYSHFFL